MRPIVIKAAVVLMTVGLAILGWQNQKLAVVLLLVGVALWLLSQESARGVWANGTHSRKFVVTVSLLCLLVGVSAGGLIVRFYSPSECAEIVQGYGALPPDLAIAYIDTRSLARDKGEYNLMLIVRSPWADGDPMKDQSIARSGVYEITGGVVRISFHVDQNVLMTIGKHRGVVGFYVVEIPKKALPNQVLDLSTSLEALGGKIVAEKGYQDKFLLNPN